MCINCSYILTLKPKAIVYVHYFILTLNETKILDPLHCCYLPPFRNQTILK